jgi:MFS family permease
MVLIGEAWPGHGRAGRAGGQTGGAVTALVGDISPARGGRVVAVFQMSADLGAIAGPLVAGWLTDVVSFQRAFAVTTAVVAAALVAAFTLPRERSQGEGHYVVSAATTAG